MCDVDASPCSSKRSRPVPPKSRMASFTPCAPAPSATWTGWELIDRRRPPAPTRRAGHPALETHRLQDEDDVDAPGVLLVDLKDLPDTAVLSVGGERSGVFERQAVLE